jgi:hypothetical protein
MDAPMSSAPRPGPLPWEPPGLRDLSLLRKVPLPLTNGGSQPKGSPKKGSPLIGSPPVMTSANQLSPLRHRLRMCSMF